MGGENRKLNDFDENIYTLSEIKFCKNIKNNFNTFINVYLTINKCNTGHRLYALPLLIFLQIIIVHC
jgi:hypothetical protein